MSDYQMKDESNAGFNGKVREALLPLINATIAEGGDNMLWLAQAITEMAHAVRATREMLSMDTCWHCQDCGRHWSVNCTVKIERDTRPDNCPECYDFDAKLRGSAKRSGWTTFRYLTSEQVTELQGR